MAQILKKERKKEYFLSLLGIVTWAYGTNIKDWWGHSNCGWYLKKNEMYG